MALNLFGWLEEITNKKSSWEKFTDDDKESFNSFMIHKYISMYEPYCEVANLAQKINYKDKERIYKFYVSIIPKKKLFLKLISTFLKTIPRSLLILLRTKKKKFILRW